MIDSVMNTELFNLDLEAEKEDAVYLQAVRKRMHKDYLSWLEDE